jgi:hypothetical protein
MYIDGQSLTEDDVVDSVRLSVCLSVPQERFDGHWSVISKWTQEDEKSARRWGDLRDWVWNIYISCGETDTSVGLRIGHSQ